MSLSVKIQDGGGNGREAEVTDQKALKVSVVDIPSQSVSPIALTQYKQYHDYMKNSSGSSSMNVNASLSVPQYFRISAISGKTIWLSSVRIIMHDSTMDITSLEARRFGSSAAAPGLTNGILLYSNQSGVRSDFFLGAVQNIADFLVYTSDFVNLPNAISSGTDLLVFGIVFSKPICLPQGSTDVFIAEIRDNLSSMTLFNIIAEGWQEIIL